MNLSRRSRPGFWFATSIALLLSLSGTAHARPSPVGRLRSEYAWHHQEAVDYHLCSVTDDPFHPTASARAPGDEGDTSAGRS